MVVTASGGFPLTSISADDFRSPNRKILFCLGANYDKHFGGVKRLGEQLQESPVRDSTTTPSSVTGSKSASLRKPLFPGHEPEEAGGLSILGTGRPKQLVDIGTSVEKVVDSVSRIEQVLSEWNYMAALERTAGYVLQL